MITSLFFFTGLPSFYTLPNVIKNVVRENVAINLQMLVHKETPAPSHIRIRCRVF